MRYSIFAFLVLVLASLACSVRAKTDDTESTSTPSTQATATTNTSNTSSDTTLATHIDAFCYAFDYPADWDLTGTSGQTMTLFNFVVEAGSDGLADGQIKLQFTPVAAGSLEAIAQGSNSQGPDYSDEPVITLPSGLEAIRTTSQDNFGDTFQLLLTQFDNTGLAVTGYGDADAFDGIVNTLRLVEDC